jgi:outer membrane immunogenic protein
MWTNSRCNSQNGRGELNNGQQGSEAQMKKLTSTVAGLLALVLPASAADLRPITKAPITPVEVPFNWTGFYIGINGGGGWGTSRHDFPAVPSTTGDFDVSGGLIGGTMGVNFQSGTMVYGLEMDLGWSSIDGNAACPGAGFVCATELQWLGTFRGRLGVAMGSVLPYVTGGIALGNIRMSTLPFVPGVGEETKAGWTVGAGREIALSPNWSIKGEYLYVDLGTATCDVLVCSGVSALDADFRAHVVRAGINYRFNWGGPVMASY